MRLENILKISLQEVLKRSSKRLEDVLKMSWKRLEDVLKAYSQDEYIGLDQDVFWRRMTKANIFVLIKTSSEDERERRLQDVFIKTNVWWAESEFFLFCYFFADFFSCVGSLSP